MAQSVSAPADVRPRLDAKGVFAAVLGNGFEFFDFTVYATYLGLIGQAFFPSDSAFVSDLAAAATFGVGFVARPLGGAVIGAYGDRAGRKPAMTLSIALMAIGSALIAVTPGYRTIGVWAPILLILARLLQGFAVGGEVGPATMFMIEAAPPERRMFFASWQIASQNLGSLAERAYWRRPGAAPDQVELQRLGLARAVRPRRPRRACRRLHPQPARRDARQPGASPPRWNRRDRDGDPAGELGRSSTRSRPDQREHNHPIFPHHHDAIRHSHAAPSGFDCDARDVGAGGQRRSRRARRRRARRPFRHSRDHDCCAPSFHAPPVSGDEVSGRQSERRDAGHGDRGAGPPACGERRGRNHADSR